MDESGEIDSFKISIFLEFYLRKNYILGTYGYKNMLGSGGFCFSPL